MKISVLRESFKTNISPLRCFRLVAPADPFPIVPQPGTGRQGSIPSFRDEGETWKEKEVEIES
jgi:hypothetical protein